MGRTGSCLDNAVAESFFAALRIEFVERLHYRTRPRAEARAWIFRCGGRARNRSSAGALGSPVVAGL
jgi:putative transposase